MYNASWRHRFQESVVGDLPSVAARATRWNYAPTDMEGKDVGRSFVRNWVDVSR
jgi:hypothetical protein